MLADWLPAKRYERPLSDGGIPLEIAADYQPAGDQPKAIRELTQNLAAGERDQVLLGVTGSGKPFTMATVIQNLQRPTLVLAPNKKMAAQLYGEMTEIGRASRRGRVCQDV